MRKFTTWVLVLVLALSLTACGRRNEKPTETAPSVTQAPTDEATLPTIDPTMGTNIPDPEVDTSMPDLMDPTGESGNAGAEGNQGNSGNTSGSTSMGN